MKVLFVFLAFAIQDSPIDTLIKQLSDETIEVRSKAESHLIERWKEWTPSDLEKLQTAAAGKEPEVANRAKAILDAIRRKTLYSDRLLKAFPDLASLLRSGSSIEVAAEVERLGLLIKRRELTGPDAVPLLIELLADDRTTDRLHPKPEAISKPAKVKDLAGDLLATLVFKPDLQTREDWKVWWDVHRGQPERDWHLPDLQSKDENVRVEAIRRLVRMNDPELHQTIVQAVSLLSTGDALIQGITELAPLPKEVLVKGVMPYFGNATLRVQVAAAKVLYPHVPEQAVQSIVNAMETPNAKRNHWMDVGGYSPEFDPTYWLAGVKDGKAYDYLLRVLRTGEEWQSTRVISAIRDKEYPGIDEALIDAFGNQDASLVSVKGNDNDDEYACPRVGDQAAMALAERLHLVERFNWVSSTRKRDRILLEIQNRWRDRAHLPLLPVPSLDPAPVNSDRVLELLPALISENEKGREEAQKKIIALGAGAYPHLHSEILRSEGAKRTALEEMAAHFSNTLRQVETRGELAKPLADKLRKHLNEPFDIDVIQSEVTDPWIQSSVLTSLYIEFERDVDGRGLTLILSAANVRSAGDSYTFQTSRGTLGGGKPLRKEALKTSIAKYFLDPLRAATEHPVGKYSFGWLRIEKYSKEDQ
jgi:HEAT repeat protein